MKTSNAIRKTCPICCGKKLHLFLSVDSHELVICENCRHVFFKDIPSNIELENYYTNKYTDGHNQIRIQNDNLEYYESHFEEIRMYASGASDISILDYGCSYPIFLEVAKNLGAKVMGCDYSDDAVVYGKSVGISVVSPDNLFSINQRFDVIRFSHSLEHMVNPSQTMKEALRLLKPNGTIYITQPSFPVFKCVGSFSKLKDSVFPSHLHFFCPLSVIELANRSGLKVIKLFTHQNECVSFNEYAPNVDYIKSINSLHNIEDCGDNHFGFLNNFPHFMGENIVAVLKRDKNITRLARKMLANIKKVMP